MGRTRLSDDERAARREADRQKTREAVEALKTSDGWQRWLALRRHFHRYSLANQLLIALQNPEATRVAGFRAWLKLGYAVRRGERAIKIWVPVPPSKKKLEEWKARGADPTARPRTWFRLGPVFDRSQVDPLPPPAEPVPLDPPIVALEGDDLAWAWPALVELGAEIGSVVGVKPLPRGCGGSYDTTTLAIAINAAASVNQRVKTLVHELGHALVRAEPADDEAPMSYDEEELVVESVAFTVCGSLGIDTAGYSIPYLASWSENADLVTIERAAATIDRIARRIEDALDGVRGDVDDGVEAGLRDAA
jgi:antirestriction protein ArdC